VNRHGGQVARAHTEQGATLRNAVVTFKVEGRSAVATRAPPEQLARREQHRLERGGRAGEAEEGLVASIGQPVAAGLLDVSHAARQVGGGAHGTRDDGPVAQDRSQDGPALVAKDIDEMVQAVDVDDARRRSDRWSSHAGQPRPW
jgi:hypothetical protein